MSDAVRLWAYRCGFCTHHSLTISRPRKCTACKKRWPELAGYVEMERWPKTPAPYPTYPDPSEFSI